MIITIFIWFQNNRFIEFDVRTLITFPFVFLYTAYHFGKYIHLIIVKGINVPGKVINVKSNILTNLKVSDFKHKPKGVTSSVGIWFH